MSARPSLVDVVADDRVAEHLAAVAGDRERGGREVDGGRRRRQRATVAEEDVDDAGVDAAGVGGRQADRVVVEAVAVDVAELRRPSRASRLRPSRRRTAARSPAARRCRRCSRRGRSRRRAQPARTGCARENAPRARVQSVAKPPPLQTAWTGASPPRTSEWKRPARTGGWKSPVFRLLHYVESHERSPQAWRSAARPGTAGRARGARRDGVCGTAHRAGRRWPLAGRARPHDRRSGGIPNGVPYASAATARAGPTSRCSGELVVRAAHAPREPRPPGRAGRRRGGHARAARARRAAARRTGARPRDRVAAAACRPASGRSSRSARSSSRCRCSPPASCSCAPRRASRRAASGCSSRCSRCGATCTARCSRARRSPAPISSSSAAASAPGESVAVMRRIGAGAVRQPRALEDARPTCSASCTTRPRARPSACGRRSTRATRSTWRSRSRRRRARRGRAALAPALWELIALGGLALLTAARCARRHVARALRGAARRRRLRRAACAPSRCRGWRKPVALALLVVVLIGIARGPLPGGASGQMVARTVALAHGTPVLAEDLLAEQVADAGGRVWVSNPIDAFSKPDQRLYVDWLRGLPAGDAALAHAPRAVLVRYDGKADRRLRRDSAFRRVERRHARGAVRARRLFVRSPQAASCQASTSTLLRARVGQDVQRERAQVVIVNEQLERVVPVLVEAHAVHLQDERRGADWHSREGRVARREATLQGRDAIAAVLVDEVQLERMLAGLGGVRLEAHDQAPWSGTRAGNVATWIESNSPRILSFPSRETLAASQSTARLTFTRAPRSSP